MSLAFELLQIHTAVELSFWTSPLTTDGRPPRSFGFHQVEAMSSVGADIRQQRKRPPWLLECVSARLIAASMCTR